MKQSLDANLHKELRVSDLKLQVEQSAKISSTRQAALVAMHGVLDALTPSPPTANLSGNSANDEAPGALAEETTNLEHEYQPPEPLTQLSPDTQPLRSSRIPPRATPDTRDGSEEEEDARPEQTELGESSLETQPQEPGEETGAADALRPAQAAIWNAVGSRRLGLAYHIALLGQAADGRADQPSPNSSPRLHWERRYEAPMTTSPRNSVSELAICSPASTSPTPINPSTTPSTSYSLPHHYDPLCLRHNKPEESLSYGGSSFRGD